MAAGFVYSRKKAGGVRFLPPMPAVSPVGLASLHNTGQTLGCELRALIGQKGEHSLTTLVLGSPVVTSQHSADLSTNHRGPYWVKC